MAAPFRRIFVDHMIAGASRVWWQMNPDFVDPFPHTFQLQAGFTGNPNATDWVDVGIQSINTLFADDDQQRLHGKSLLTHYRVKLTTSLGVYISPITPVDGILPEKDWLFARELGRKEVLRAGLVARPGILLKRLRFGARCDKCLDNLTNEVTDSKCPTCRGVGFKTGYHPPMPMQFWDLSNKAIDEQRGGARPPGPTAPVMVKARVLGAPMLSAEDVWVDQFSDQRWFIHQIEHTAEVRGVPIAMDVTLKLAPFSDEIYRLQVGGEPSTLTEQELPTAGCGAIRVDHNYGSPDALAYQVNGCGVLGATILAFTEADYAHGLRSAANAKAASTTLANGRWSYAMQLDKGDYVIQFYKPGEYGPDIVEISVQTPAQASSSSSVSEPLFMV